VAGLGQSKAHYSIVVAGDMPDLVPAVLRAMVRVAEERDASAVALAVENDVVPLPCVLASVALEVGQGLLRNNESSLRALLGALQAVAISEPDWRSLDPNGDTFHDIDEPEQLP
jgi:molybdopterin-guanine dinucleotide biosynthesis protein A